VTSVLLGIKRNVWVWQRCLGHGNTFTCKQATGILYRQEPPRGLILSQGVHAWAQTQSLSPANTTAIILQSSEM
jgi:hypothetical protein